MSDEEVKISLDNCGEVAYLRVRRVWRCKNAEHLPHKWDSKVSIRKSDVPEIIAKLQEWAKFYQPQTASAGMHNVFGKLPPEENEI